MALTLKAKVQGGRLRLDEPIDLPDGAEVELMPIHDGDDLDDEDRARLHESLHLAEREIEAGQVVDAAEVLRRLPASDAFHDEHTRWTTSTTELPAQLLANATPRWNATAERFERLTDEFSTDAPELVTQLTQRFSALSDKFNAGLTARDAIETETTLDAANSELTKAVTALRQLHPDCPWQQRVTRTF